MNSYDMFILFLYISFTKQGGVRGGAGAPPRAAGGVRGGTAPSCASLHVFVTFADSRSLRPAPELTFHV